MEYEFTKAWYDLIVREENGGALFRLKIAPYEGVVYWYGERRWREAPEGEIRPLEFTFQIADTPAGFNMALVEDTKFTNILGAILMGVLEEDAYAKQDGLQVERFIQTSVPLREIKERIDLDGNMIEEE